MEDRGVVCGEMGGKRDWKTVVESCSRCFGMEFGDDSFDAFCVKKLFMTSLWEISWLISHIPAPKGRTY